MSKILEAQYSFTEGDESNPNEVATVLLNIDFDNETFEVHPLDSSQQGFVFDHKYCTRQKMWRNLLIAIDHAIVFAESELKMNKSK